MYDFTSFWFTSTHFNIRWIRLKSTLYYNVVDETELEDIENLHTHIEYEF